MRKSFRSLLGVRSRSNKGRGRSLFAQGAAVGGCNRLSLLSFNCQCLRLLFVCDLIANGWINNHSRSGG